MPLIVVTCDRKLALKLGALESRFDPSDFTFEIPMGTSKFLYICSNCWEDVFKPPLYWPLDSELLKLKL
jgi:hypothetical protein